MMLATSRVALRGARHAGDGYHIVDFRSGAIAMECGSTEPASLACGVVETDQGRIAPAHTCQLDPDRPCDMCSVDARHRWSFVRAVARHTGASPDELSAWHPAWTD